MTNPTITTASEIPGSESIKHKSALVTGGTSGIGLATARMLLEHGARVLVYGLYEEEVNAALAELGQLGEVHGFCADQSRPEHIRHIFEKVDSLLGDLDILVNSAGRYASSVLKTDADVLHAVVVGNVYGHMAVTREAVLRMKERRSGHIVDIGSLSADLRERHGEVYVATKAAIQAFSASLCKTVNPLGIRVSLIEPGLVATPMNYASLEEQQSLVAERKMLMSWNIADAVYYCLTRPPQCDVISLQIRPHLQSI